MNLLQTFVLPWGPLPLAIVVLTLAAVGVAVLLRRDRRGLVLLGGRGRAVRVFHLVWQENVTTRYALPIVPAIALLAAIGLRGLAASRAWPRRMARRGVVDARPPAIAGPLASHVPVFALFTRSPSRRRCSDCSATCDWRAGVRRSSSWRCTAGPSRRRGARGAGSGRRGSRGGCSRRRPGTSGWRWCATGARAAPAGRGFVADLRRTDLALIDPASRHDNGHYGWSIAVRLPASSAAPGRAARLGGDRRSAGWFLGEGWALSPEIAGVSDVDGKGPARRRRRRLDAPQRGAACASSSADATSAARARRRPASRCARRAGARHLGRRRRRPDSSCAASRCPGRHCRECRPAAEAGSSQAEFAALRVTAAAADGSPSRVPTAVEQFGLQPLDAVQFAFAEGWHEDELQPAHRAALAVVERRVLDPGLAGRSRRPDPAVLLNRP